jgi:hypothetical protein
MQKMWAKVSPLHIALLCAALLYAIGLGAAPFWYDETGSVWMASLPWPRLMAATAADTHPPLYLLLLSMVQWALGPERWAMRLPSAVCGLGVIALTWAIARELRFERAALWLSLAFVATSTWQVYYAQEARMYTLFQALTLGALWAALRSRITLFATLGGLSLYTHNYALIYLVVNCGVLAWTMWRLRGAWRPLSVSGPLSVAALAGLVSVFAWLPWAGMLYGQMRIVQTGYWIQPVTPGAVVDVLYHWLGGGYTPAWMMPSVVILSTGLLSCAALRAVRSREPEPLVLLWCVVAPVTLAVVASLVWRPMFLFRGFAPSVPLFLMLTAWAITYRTGWPVRAVALGLVAPVMALALVGYYASNADNKGRAYEDAYTLVAAQLQPGDVLLTNQEGGVLSARYSALDGQTVYLLPRCGHIIGGLSAATRAAMGIAEATPESLQWRRLWFLLGAAPTIPACNVEQSRAFLSAHRARLVTTMRDDAFVTAQVWLVER